MAKQGFKRDYKVVSQILRSDPGLLAALKAAAEEIAKDAGGEVVEYETDRAVFGVQVEAHEQAINGSLTKAVGKRGKTLS